MLSLWAWFKTEAAHKSFVLTVYFLQTFTDASVKVIQLLQHFEQLSSVFAQAVSVWSTEYGIRAVIGDVIRSEHMI